MPAASNRRFHLPSDIGFDLPPIRGRCPRTANDIDRRIRQGMCHDNRFRFVEYGVVSFDHLGDDLFGLLEIVAVTDAEFHVRRAVYRSR